MTEEMKTKSKKMRTTMGQRMRAESKKALVLAHRGYREEDFNPDEWMQ